MTESDHKEQMSPAETEKESDIVRRRRPVWLMLMGMCVSALGVLSNFELERSSYAGNASPLYHLLQYTYIPMLMLGLLATLIGSAIWARHAPLVTLLWSGLLLGALALAGPKVTPINLHDWTGSIMFVYVAALLIGILFLIFAAVRYISRPAS